MVMYKDLPQTFKELDIDLNKIPRYSILDFFVKKLGRIYRNPEFIQPGIECNAKQNENEDETPNNTIKGLYIFFDDDKPIYIGISRNIIRRLKQHFYGKLHNHCTVAYQIAREEHKSNVSKEILKSFYDKENSPREEIQSRMRENWKIAIIPEINDYRLALKEICYAIKYKTKYNSFKTH